MRIRKTSSFPLSSLVIQRLDQTPFFTSECADAIQAQDLLPLTSEKSPEAKEEEMTISQVMLNHPLETLAWTGVLSFIVQGLVVGFIRCCREKSGD